MAVVAGRPGMRLHLVGVAVLVALSAGYLVTGVQSNLLVATPGYGNRIGNSVGTDFTAFYAAAVLAREGRARAPYDVDALHAAHERVRGVAIGRQYAWAYPPTMLLLLLPMTLLPLVPAMWAWLAATTALLVLAARRILPSPLTPLLVVLFPGLATSLFTGPTGTLSAAVVATGLVLLERRPALGGAVLALLSVKPHLAGLLPLCLIAARQGRALLAFVLAGVGLVAASALAFGVGPWLDFVAALPRHMAFVEAGQSPWMRMPTAFIAVLHATDAAALAWNVQAIVTIAVVAACVWVWRRSDDPMPRALVLTAGIPLVGPYAYDYDTCALVVAILYLVRGLGRGAPLGAYDAVVLAVLWATPVALWLVSTAVGQQVGPLLLGGLVAEAVRRSPTAPATSRAAPPRRRS